MNTIAFSQLQLHCRAIHLMFQHDNARPHVASICIQFLEPENVPVLPWSAYSPDMSPIKHVWNALDQRVRKRVPVPANIQQLCAAIEEEWDNNPQATINSMRRRCVALHESHQILDLSRLVKVGGIRRREQIVK
jgi:hypothetical protein